MKGSYNDGWLAGVGSFKSVETAAAFLFFALCCRPQCLHAQTAVPAPRLSGLISLPGLKVAIMEALPPSVQRGELRSWHGPQQWILKEGERDGKLEALEIRPGDSAVKINESGNRVTLNLTNQTAREAGTAPSISLEGLDMNSLLRLYGELTKRTLLRYPALPKVGFTLKATATNRTEAATALENALAQENIATIKDGDKFIMVLPKEQVRNAHPHSQLLSSNTSTNSETLPQGAIDLRNADVNQVALIYAELTGHQLDRTTPILLRGPASSLWLTSQGSLAKEEVIYALETILGWAGVKFISVGGNVIRAVAD